MIEPTATAQGGDGWVSVEEMVTEVAEARGARDVAVERCRRLTQRAAVWAVCEAGMSRKDAGAVLGLSHQRIGQLLDGRDSER